MSQQQLRLQAKRLYREVSFLTNRKTGESEASKQLYVLGKDYPDPSYGFHARLKKCYGGKNAEADELEYAVKKAEFIKKEVEALIYLHVRASRSDSQYTLMQEV